jgi:hypothetical protein
MGCGATLLFRSSELKYRITNISTHTLGGYFLAPGESFDRDEDKIGEGLKRLQKEKIVKIEPVVPVKSKSEPKATPKPEPKPKSEPKPEPKPKPDVKPDAKPKSEPKPDAKPKVEPEPESN